MNVEAELCKLRKIDNDELEGIIKREKRWEAIGRISGDQRWKQERGGSGIGINRNLFQTEQKLNLKLVGKAYQKGDSFILTESYSSAGGLWNEINGNDIHISFDVQNIEAQADGFAVVLQTEGNHVIGAAGAGKGFRNIRNGIVVEFSLFESHEAHDPNRFHVAILKPLKGILTENHISCVDCCLNPTCYWDGRIHHVDVIFTSTAIKP